MNIECPHCKFIYDSKDIAHTLKNGIFKCPICGKNIPSSSTDKPKSSVSLINNSKYLTPVFILLGIIVAVVAIYLFTSKDKTSPVAKAVIPAVTDHSSSPSPTAPSVPLDAPAPQETIAAPNAPPKDQMLDKMKIVELIAAMYHVSHSYTMDGGFVCLDMAIDVWNQLRTRGIEAKIMGGILTENITTWNYRQLAMESNHAWVVATITPTEKVAIETTAGIVIKPGMKEYSAYLKGIEFDSPAQIKRFELLRKTTYANCRATNQMINEWNENVAGKQLSPEDVISKKSQIEQRKMDCENSFNGLKEYESKAIFY